MSVKCQVIIDAMEKLAPRYLAEGWDNVGLLVGNPAQTVAKVLVALDLTLETAQQAAEDNVDLIITHHPYIFKGIQHVRTDLPHGKILSILLKKDIAVYSAHTNLDVAENGVNDLLARLFNLESIENLTTGFEEKLCKLVVFVPETHLEEVRTAITKAGAGHIGEYSHCTFYTSGTGSFLPLEEASPYIGQQGKLEYVQEARLETILPERIVRRVVKAMLKAHPYEEAAYDIYPLQNKGKTLGLGRIGSLLNPMHLEDFAFLVKEKLGVASLRIAGNIQGTVRKVAVCGGSGAGLIPKAAFAGADVLVTGDVKYHEGQDAVAAGIAVIDAGHFATEVPVVEYLKRYLMEYSQKDRWNVEITTALTEKDIFSVL